ncbi:ribosome silencing factor [Frankia sp. AgB1.9]|uniref:ribosome silencing factor n=1 Tax=unclassified Frankia TaxID=2632575 RepID=UPI0019312DBC|nr:MULTISPECIES: ribosome silencing factor [unclassified Frankia]MBL7486624.1 ribosome silencing factor [Frankia sp. AgW1.1]MBL7552010.1 ribosome silencing factor [Frankia sp. AgB1.9]MBL7618319.1 ribosome silencing factor [Frankia sp. AgB1.8]
MTASPRAVELALIAAQAAADKLAKDITVLDVSDRLALTDCFVLASADNERQVKAVVDEVEERLRLIGVKPLRREGEREGRWVLLDFVEIVVHVQRIEEREFYDLERLWKDCPQIEFVDRDAAARTAVPVGGGSESGVGSAAGGLLGDPSGRAGSW